MSRVLADEQGRAFWLSMWRDQQDVPFAEFSTALRAHLHTLGAPAVQNAERVLRFTMDSLETSSSVSQQAFDLFLCRFGPLALSLSKANASFFEHGALVPWFHGRLSRTEAEALLRGAGDGSFLVRFSERHPSKFTLTYLRVEEGQPRLRNCLICNAGERGFAMSEHPEPGEPVFASLRHFVSKNAHKLIQPCQSALAARFLDYVRAETARQLAGAGAGSAPLAHGLGPLRVPSDGSMSGGDEYGAFDAGALPPSAQAQAGAYNSFEEPAAAAGDAVLRAAVAQASSPYGQFDRGSLAAQAPPPPAPVLRQNSGSQYGEFESGAVLQAAQQHQQQPPQQQPQDNYGELAQGEISQYLQFDPEALQRRRSDAEPTAGDHLREGVLRVVASDFAGAVEHLQRSVDAAQPDDSWAERRVLRQALEQLASCKQRLGDVREAGALYSRLLGLVLEHRRAVLAAEEEDTARAAELDEHLKTASWRLARCLVADRRASEAVPHFATALGLATDAADRSVILDELQDVRDDGALAPLQPREAEHVLARAVESFKLANYADAERQFADAVLCARLAGDRVVEARALNNWGTLLNKQEARKAEAVDLYARCLSVTRTLNDRKKLWSVLNNLYVACKALGRFASARRHCEALLRLAEDAHNVRTLQGRMEELGRLSLAAAAAASAGGGAAAGAVDEDMAVPE